MKVTIFHNVTHDGFGRNVGFFGYQPGHALVPVFVYDDSLSEFTEVCEQAFHLFNVGDDPEFGTPDERALAYRKARNRSLSTGDVVMVNIGDVEHWYSCASIGWTEIDPPQFVVWASCYGTTALDPQQHPLPKIHPQIAQEGR
jgi:hypothetical protein